MLDQKKIERINELARKSREVGLTEEEALEQGVLRKEYLASWREGIKATLDNTYVQYPDGTKVKLKDQ
jgi:uncharacterized protein YnzC (UPF0291/DUF896 family)